MSGLSELITTADRLDKAREGFEIARKELTEAEHAYANLQMELRKESQNA